MKKYYNTPCSIFTLGTSVVRGSKVEIKTPLYENINCAIWKKTQNYNQSIQAIQTDRQEYTMNLEGKYTGVSMWDIVVINSKSYKVINDPIPHEESNGKIDNYELFIQITTEST